MTVKCSDLRWWTVDRERLPSLQMAVPQGDVVVPQGDVVVPHLERCIAYHRRRLPTVGGLISKLIGSR
jgi:hypothetical protein